MNAPLRAPGRQMLRGSAWMIGLRWSQRLAGVASTMVLARLLTPADFGTIAIAMLFVGLVETLGDTGERLALIRLQQIERADYDTAFTLQLLVGIVIGAGVFLLAPLASLFFHAPQAVPVIRLLSLRAVLSGFENIGTVDFRRDFRFEAAYAMGMRAKFVSLAAAVILAVLTHSYWALAIGILVNQAALTALSYGMHAYRPRPSLARWRQLSNFSFWTLLRSLGLYLTSQVDQIAVASFAAAGSMGRYAVAMDVAASPTNEIHAPVVGVLYPVLSRYQQDYAMLRAIFLRVFGWTMLVCAATGAGLLAIAPDYAMLMLGRQWSGVEQLIPWLALAASIACVTNTADPVFDTLGQPNWSAKLQWLRLLVLAAAIAVTALFWRSLEAMAVARLIVIAGCAPLILVSIARALTLSISDYLALAWRPILAAAAMSLIVAELSRFMPASLGGRLVLEVSIGACAYGGTILLLWILAGQPDGAETDIVSATRTGLQWGWGRAQKLLGTVL